MAFPNCGGTATVSGPPTFFASALVIYALISSGVGTIVTIVGFISAAAAKIDVISSILTAVGGFLGGASSFGAAAYVAIGLAAVTTAIVIIVWAKQSHNGLCGSPPAGKFECVTGVVDAVTPGFAFWYSDIAGFANNQPRADVVVKSIYWPIVTLNNPPMVWCAGCTNCPGSAATAAQIADPAAPCSPTLACYYHDSRVCGASAGGAVGATVGAAVGAVGGIILAIFAFGALGCSFTAVFSWICLLVLLLVVVIAIAVVAIVAAIGSAIGTQAGKAAAGGTSTPMTGPGMAITPGTYVSILGNMVQSIHSLGANVLWFAGWIPTGTSVNDDTATNMNGTTVLGLSTGTVPFCYTDPDTNISAAFDTCPVPSP